MIQSKNPSQHTTPHQESRQEHLPSLDDVTTHSPPNSQNPLFIMSLEVPLCPPSLEALCVYGG